VPEWYFLPFYAILRATPDIGIPFTNIVFVGSKLAGVLLMFGSILIMFALPWIDKSSVRSATFRPQYRVLFWIFVINAVILGWLGQKPAEGIYIVLGRISLVIYFGYFAALAWLTYSGKEKTLPLPESISKAVLDKNNHAHH
jgi:ubiquinol-cytochrome c reductase cytochrome b subunit